MKSSTPPSTLTAPRRLIPSVTTIGLASSSWRDKIKEITELRLSEVALFVTGLNDEERAECFAMLREAQAYRMFQIPFVHATQGMRESEYLMLMNQFGTQRFNLHPERDYPLSQPLSTFVRERIFIENSSKSSLIGEIFAPDIAGFGGMCIDLSHLEQARIIDIAVYERIVKLSRTFSVGANHISAVRLIDDVDGEAPSYRSTHISFGPADFAYLATLNSSVFSDLMVIELENSLSDQISLIPAIQAALAEAECFCSEDSPDRPFAISTENRPRVFLRD